MKRQYIFLATGILMLTSAGAANALSWCVTANVTVRVIPTRGGNASKAVAKGFHRLLLTKITAADLLLPVRFKITAAELHRDGIYTDGCPASPWIYGWNKTSTFCTTKYTEEDCISAYWEAWTWGQLQLHPSGGLKQTVDGPSFSDCGCT